MQFVVLILLLAVQHQADAQQPAIVGDILPEVKKSSETGYLNCTVVNKGPGDEVIWIKEETPMGHPMPINRDEFITEYIRFKFDVQVRRNGRETTFMLVIRDLTLMDGGNYSCNIRIPGVAITEWPKKTGTLTVLVAPSIREPDSILRAFHEQLIGSSLTLNCDAFGVPFPNITWTREDRKELPIGRSQIQGAQLNLTNIQKDDRGKYICVADNGIPPPASWEVEVKVFFPPTCAPVQSAVGQAQNRRYDAKLECKVAGYPSPSVSWMRDNYNGNRILIEEDEKYTISKHYSSGLQEDEARYSLIVNNVQANDYRKYYCVGKNRYGEGRTSITLFETMECEGSNCPP